MLGTPEALRRGHARATKTPFATACKHGDLAFIKWTHTHLKSRYGLEHFKERSVGFFAMGEGRPDREFFTASPLRQAFSHDHTHGMSLIASFICLRR